MLEFANSSPSGKAASLFQHLIYQYYSFLLEIRNFSIQLINIPSMLVTTGTTRVGSHSLLLEIRNFSIQLINIPSMLVTTGTTRELAVTASGTIDVISASDKPWLVVSWLQDSHSPSTLST